MSFELHLILDGFTWQYANIGRRSMLRGILLTVPLGRR